MTNTHGNTRPGSKWWWHNDKTGCGIPFKHLHYGVNVVVRPERPMVPEYILEQWREWITTNA